LTELTFAVQKLLQPSEMEVLTDLETQKRPTAIALSQDGTVVNFDSLSLFFYRFWHPDEEKLRTLRSLYEVADEVLEGVML
jgi:hypothetical protein